MGAEATRGLRAWIVSMPAPEGVHAQPRVWGLSAEERLRRALISGEIDGIDCLAQGEQPPVGAEACLVLRDDLFYDPRLVRGLLETGMRGVVLRHRIDGSSRELPVAALCDPSQLAEAVSLLRGEASEAAQSLRDVEARNLAPAYDSALRKFHPASVHSAYGPPERLAEIENQLFAASYKGITDLVTKWVFPVPARATVRVLSRWGIRPNTVTSLSYLLAALVMVLFAQGWFAMGLAAAWVMTFLDTVDGKLARCTLTSTKFGNVFDHGLDMVHPPFWWGAWAMGLPGGIAEHELVFWIVIGGYIVGRILEGVFQLAFGIQPHVWQPFDAFFRQIIARRNPNLLLLTASVVVGRPDWGLTAIALWTCISVAVIATRNVQARLRARGGEDIHSWLDDLEPPAAHA